jgi:hypothetical protein
VTKAYRADRDGRPYLEGISFEKDSKEGISFEKDSKPMPSLGEVPARETVKATANARPAISRIAIVPCQPSSRALPSRGCRR